MVRRERLALRGMLLRLRLRLRLWLRLQSSPGFLLLWWLFLVLHWSVLLLVVLVCWSLWGLILSERRVSLPPLLSLLLLLPLRLAKVWLPCGDGGLNLLERAHPG